MGVGGRGEEGEKVGVKRKEKKREKGWDKITGSSEMIQSSP